LLQPRDAMSTWLMPDDAVFLSSSFSVVPMTWNPPTNNGNKRSHTTRPEDKHTPTRVHARCTAAQTPNNATTHRLELRHCSLRLALAGQGLSQQQSHVHISGGVDNSGEDALRNLQDPWNEQGAKHRWVQAKRMAQGRC
jgi:hypothetical protein